MTKKTTEKPTRRTKAGRLVRDMDTVGGLRALIAEHESGIAHSLGLIAKIRAFGGEPGDMDLLSWRREVVSAAKHEIAYREYLAEKNRVEVESPEDVARGGWARKEIKERGGTYRYEIGDGGR